RRQHVAGQDEPGQDQVVRRPVPHHGSLLKAALPWGDPAALRPSPPPRPRRPTAHRGRPAPTRSRPGTAMARRAAAGAAGRRPGATGGRRGSAGRPGSRSPVAPGPAPTRPTALAGTTRGTAPPARP